MTNYLVYPPAPGKKHGPCKGFCSHIMCAVKRHDSERICPYCQEPLGYNGQVYLNWRQPVHRKCFERQIQSRQTSQPGIVEGWLAGKLNNDDLMAAFPKIDKNGKVIGSEYNLTTGIISD